MTVPARITAVHKNAIVLAHDGGAVSIPRALCNNLPPVTVGDWLLLDAPRTAAGPQQPGEAPGSR